MKEFIGVIAMMIALLVLACDYMRDITRTYGDAKQEIIARLWLPQDRPEGVTSVEIAKRLKELDIDVNR